MVEELLEELDILYTIILSMLQVILVLVILVEAGIVIKADLAELELMLRVAAAMVLIIPPAVAAVGVAGMAAAVEPEAVITIEVVLLDRVVMQEYSALEELEEQELLVMAIMQVLQAAAVAVLVTYIPHQPLLIIHLDVY